MKKLTSFAMLGLLAFGGLAVTGCGGGGDNKVVELEKDPPPALNQVQMEDYSKQQKSAGAAKPGN